MNLRSLIAFRPQLHKQDSPFDVLEQQGKETQQRFFDSLFHCCGHQLPSDKPDMPSKRGLNTLAIALLSRIVGRDLVSELSLSSCQRQQDSLQQVAQSGCFRGPNSVNGDYLAKAAISMMICPCLAPVAISIIALVFSATAISVIIVIVIIVSSIDTTIDDVVIIVSIIVIIRISSTLVIFIATTLVV